MTDTFFMKIFQHICNLLRNRQNFFRRELFSINRFLRYLMSKIRKLTILHDNVGGSLLLVKIIIMIADDTFVVEGFDHSVKVFESAPILVTDIFYFFQCI